MNNHVWIFQANPKRYNISDAISDLSGDHKHWLVNQCKEDIICGDTCLIWMSGKNAGIYAVGEILTDPKYIYDSEIETDYWVNDDDKNKRRLRVRFDYTLKLNGNPVSRSELIEVPELKQMRIFRQPQGTNFPVTNDEWRIISELINCNLKTSAS